MKKTVIALIIVSVILYGLYLIGIALLVDNINSIVGKQGGIGTMAGKTVHDFNKAANQK